MRVLYASLGGSPHDDRFARAIASQGHQVARASSGDLRVAIDSGQFDVIHAGPIPTVGAVVAAATDAPLVLMSWGSDILLDCENEAVRVRAIAALRRADALLGDCAAVGRRLRAWLPDVDVPYIEFPWGVELERFGENPRAAAELRRKLGWSDAVMLICTRSWEPLYGVETLLDAFSHCASIRPDLRLVLASDGSRGAAIRARISELGLEEKVHCPGRLAETELPLWYQAADLYMSAARCDGSSVSLLEAMACGLPVVTHAGGGNAEWIGPGRNGWLVDASDPAALASGIATALEAQHRWPEIGERNRQQVRRRADWSRNSLQLSVAYEKAVARRRGAGV